MLLEEGREHTIVLETVCPPSRATFPRLGGIAAVSEEEF